MLIKLSLFFFFFLSFLEIESPELLEEGEDGADLWKYDFFGVVGGEGNIVGVAGVTGTAGVVALWGVDGSCLAGSLPSLLPLCCLTSSGLVSFCSSSFFSVRRVLEEEVPVEGFLGLLTGRVWVEGVSVCLTGSGAGGCLSTVVASFTGTKTSGAFVLAGVG